MSATVLQEVKKEAKGFKVWSIENAYDYPDKLLNHGDIILNSDHGAVLTAGGILQLTGAGKTGKSMLLLNLCYGLAMGKDTLGFGIEKARKVLYINGENSALTMQERFKLLREYYCIDSEQTDKARENLLFASTSLLLPKPEAMREIEGNLSEVRPEILILDPLKNFYSGEENSADNMREFMAAVRVLIEKFSLTVIIVHHTGKKQNENNFYSGRGSSLLADDAETTASFQKDANNKGLFNLFVTGRNCDEFTVHLTRQPERWYLYSLTDKPEPLPDHTLIEIIGLLPDKFTTGQFHEAAVTKGLSVRTAGNRIRTALDAGLITKVVQGNFRKVHVMQFPVGAAQPAQQDQPAETVMQVMQKSAEGAICITEPADEYRGLF